MTSPQDPAKRDLEEGNSSKGKGPLERLLTLFTDVKGGEGAPTLLLALAIFLILTAYYIIKPVREAWILAGPGAEVKSYASAIQAGLLLLVFVPLYSRLASRLPRMRLLNTVNLFFAANLVIWFVLGRLFPNASWLAIAFFMWVGIFNLMVPAQFWSFANDYYTVGQGKRLFAIVAFGASAGAVLGSKITDLLIEPVGLVNLLLLSAGLLVVANLVVNRVQHIENRARLLESPPIADGDGEHAGLGKGNAFGLVMRSRYLLLIALLMLVLNWVNTNGEYILGRAVEETVEVETVIAQNESADPDFDFETQKGEAIGKFYADFFFVVNILGLVLQLFAVSRIIKYVGIPKALLILPIISLGTYSLLFFFPGRLNLIRWGKTAENATDYSLQNTVRQALFLPTTTEQKYKAKQAIDSFFVRAGDVFSALVVYVGVTMLDLSLRGFAAVNIVLVVIWLYLAARTGREYRRLTGD